MLGDSEGAGSSPLMVDGKRGNDNDGRDRERDADPRRAFCLVGADRRPVDAHLSLADLESAGVLRISVAERAVGPLMPRGAYATSVLREFLKAEFVTSYG